MIEAIHHSIVKMSHKIYYFAQIPIPIIFKKEKLTNCLDFYIRLKAQQTKSFISLSIFFPLNERH